MAASARELARAAEASATASSVLNSELRGKLVSLANEAAADAERLASATADAGRVREELASAARRVASTEVDEKQTFFFRFLFFRFSKRGR